MGKKHEVRVFVGDATKAARALTLVVQGRELYVVTHLQPMDGKTSHHASGQTHSDFQILGGARVGREIRRAWHRVEGQKLVAAQTFLPSPPVTPFDSKPDNARRMTLFAPFPQYLWGVDIWAVESHAIAKRISTTRPWPDCPVVANLLLGAVTPMLLVTVWQSAVEQPYEVVQIIDPAGRPHPVPGIVPFEIVPAAFEGTWLDSGRRWRPGNPWPPGHPDARPTEVSAVYRASGGPAQATDIIAQPLRRSSISVAQLRIRLCAGARPDEQDPAMV